MRTVKAAPFPAEEGPVVRHNHPILVLTIMGGLPLAIAGDPAAFVLLVMTSPLIIIMIFSCAASCTAAEASRTRVPAP